MARSPAKTLAQAGRRRRKALQDADAALEDGLKIIAARAAAGERVDIKAAAEALGCSRSTIYARLPQLTR